MTVAAHIRLSIGGTDARSNTTGRCEFDKATPISFASRRLRSRTGVCASFQCNDEPGLKLVIYTPV